ncbi:unnamed protein product [Allacma fusca]|uniref:Uncharacterized protein n=1 Tax=Allacma fusca TaxID=39272 RepID=A0A8J2LMF8_9HEXA|nr:unnamed protein product [Allacma fusca]
MYLVCFVLLTRVQFRRVEAQIVKAKSVDKLERFIETHFDILTDRFQFYPEILRTVTHSQRCCVRRHSHLSILQV